MGHVDIGFGRFIHLAVTHIPHDPDHLGAVEVVHSEADVLADRVLARPETACRGFVDQHHFGRILPVGIREHAAP